MKKICLFKIIFAVFQLKKTAAAVVATSLSSRGNKRETRQWQKAVTLLALGFVLCVQGIAGGEGKGQDPPPPSPAMNCASPATLSPGNPVGDDLSHLRSSQMNPGLQH